jgi:hypothetical protein
MHTLGMVTFLTSVKVVNGLFAIPKDKDSQRLIIDARPANAYFIEPPHVHLPTPDIFASLHVPPHTKLWIAKVDLDNFYHRLLLPLWMRPYFALPPLHPRQIGLTHIFGDTLIYPCCTTMPMGWSHAVTAAQNAHEHILNTFTLLRPADRLTATSDHQLDRPRHGVYIDDLVLVGTNRQELSRLQDNYMKVVSQIGLPPKLLKVVPPSRSVECLGFVIDGLDLTVGVSPTKVHRLIHDTLETLAMGSCTGYHMAKLVGRWSWTILPNRPAFSVFNAVYRFVTCAGARTFLIWNSVSQELHTIIGLAPLLFSHLDAQWFHKTVATDASQVGMGIVAAPLPSSYTSRTPPSQLVSSLPWSTIVSSKWHHQEHINVLELRAISTALRWVLSHPHSSYSRLLFFSDSLVAVGALSKGRSSAYQILRRLRHISACLLAARLQLSTMWIPSANNPADGPSRTC